MKKTIRISKSKLDQIIKESVNRLINEEHGNIVDDKDTFSKTAAFVMMFELEETGNAFSTPNFNKIYATSQEHIDNFRANLKSGNSIRTQLNYHLQEFLKTNSWNSIKKYIKSHEEEIIQYSQLSELLLMSKNWMNKYGIKATDLVG